MHRVAPRSRLAALIVVAAAVLLSGCGKSGSAAVSPSTGAAGVTTPASNASTTPGLAPASPVSSLRTVAVQQLPPQAVDTLRLIAKGGPYPFSRDGVTFSNREGILPRHPSGWYHEYTVVTPGSSDRGARRIIAGQDGGRFYTDDHYASFREVVAGVSG